MTETVKISRNSLKHLVEMHADATQLLEKIPKMQDQGRFSEASQHIGAELEARVNLMHKVQKNNETVNQLISEHADKQTKTDLEDLEDEVLG